MSSKPQELAIRVSHLSKCYQIYDKPNDRLKQFIAPRLQRLLGKQPKQYFREFWALKDISFDIKKSETVGIIGRNGSGKSTLLQMICGTLHPTAGEIEVNGRVAALLELGSGFNPEFTGRENVYLNASVLGLTHEQTATRFAEIEAFADIGEFIDQPVKTYSSGMMVRLAFAVIAHVDADILVVDEALAVGDVFFQQKCMRFLRDHQKKGGTMLLVTHDTTTVLNLCQAGLLLYAAASKPSRFGISEHICKLYLEDLYADITIKNELVVSSHTQPKKENMSLVKFHHFDCEEISETLYSVSHFNHLAESFGVKGATIIDGGFFNSMGERLSILKGEETVYLTIVVVANREIIWPAFGFMLKNGLGEYLFTEGTDKYFRKYELKLAKDDKLKATFKFVMPHLIQGKYFINLAFAEGLGDDHIQHHWIHDAIQLDVISGRVVHGYAGMNAIEMYIDIEKNTLDEHIYAN